MFDLKDKTILVTGGGSGSGEAISTLFTRITSQEEVTRTVEEIVKKTGVVDILINNAGIPHIGTVESTEDADMDRLFSVNVKGAYHIIRL